MTRKVFALFTMMTNLRKNQIPHKTQKIPQTQTKPQKISQKHKSPPPSPYFQPLKLFFVIFRNTFLKKFANFCHKSEKLYYNFIILKICLQSRVCLNALQQAHTPFAASKSRATKASKRKRQVFVVLTILSY